MKSQHTYTRRRERNRGRIIMGACVEIRFWNCFLRSWFLGWSLLLWSWFQNVAWRPAMCRGRRSECLGAAQGPPQAQGEQAFISQMLPLASLAVAPFARDRLPVSSAVKSVNWYKNNVIVVSFVLIILSAIGRSVYLWNCFHIMALPTYIQYCS